MTTTQHSSGPWRVWQNRISPTESELEIFDSENYKVANIARWKDEGKHESEANARLIAAAPRLLEILKDILPEFIGLYEQFDPTGEIAVWEQWTEEAMEVIAEAEGK